MLNSKQLETAQELKDHGYILYWQDSATGEVYMKKPAPGLTGGPPEYYTAIINIKGEVAGEEE